MEFNSHFWLWTALTRNIIRASGELSLRRAMGATLSKVSKASRSDLPPSSKLATVRP